jgi:hypothetical protein
MQQNPVPFLDREQDALTSQLGTLYARVRESQTQLISKLLNGDVRLANISRLMGQILANGIQQDPVSL